MDELKPRRIAKKVLDTVEEIEASSVRLVRAAVWAMSEMDAFRKVGTGELPIGREVAPFPLGSMNFQEFGEKLDELFHDMDTHMTDLTVSLEKPTDSPVDDAS